MCPCATHGMHTYTSSRDWESLWPLRVVAVNVPSTSPLAASRVKIYLFYLSYLFIIQPRPPLLLLLSSSSPPPPALPLHLAPYTLHLALHRTRTRTLHLAPAPAPYLAPCTACPLHLAPLAPCTACTLHLAPCTYTCHLAPCTLHLTSRTLHLHLAPCTLYLARLHRLHLVPCTLYLACLHSSGTVRK